MGKSRATTARAGMELRHRLNVAGISVPVICDRK